MEGGGSPESDRAPKRRRVACNQCRQSKLRCSSEETPCPRCQRLGLDCAKDPGYKRVNRQSKIEELELQVQQLRGIASLQTDTGISPVAVGVSPAPASSDRINSSSHDYENQSAAIPQSPSDPSSQSQSRSPPEGCRSLGPVKLDITQVKSLFSIFFGQYHHFLPFLEPSRTPDQYFEASALLFWSIIATAARQYRADASLLTRLSAPITELIGTTIASNQMDLGTVQALIIMSTWSLPFVGMWSDNSLVFANVALTTSQHLGIREDLINGNTEVKQDVLERMRTRVACVILAQSLAVQFGHSPGMLLFDWTINRACQPNSGFNLPTELRHSLIIQKWSNKAFLAFSQNQEDPMGLPPLSQRSTIIAGLEYDFDVMADELGTNLSFINNLRLQGARVYLQTMYFLDENWSKPYKTGILKAYSTASGLISSLLSDVDSHELLSHAPLITFRFIFCAALIIWKTLNSSFAGELDRGAGKVLFNAAAFAIRQVSVQHSDAKDLPARAAEGLSMLWRYGDSNPSLRNQEPTSRIKNRMGCSLMYDCLISLQEYKRRACLPTGLDKVRSNTIVAFQGALGPSTSNNVATTNEFPQSTAAGNVQGMSIDDWEALPDMNWIWDYGFPGTFDAIFDTALEGQIKDK